MKRRGNTIWLMAILAAGMLMLSACKDADSGVYDDVRSPVSAAEPYSKRESFTGEWTVGKQVVDTARLEVSEVLRVRLPEAYLVSLCFDSFTEEYGTDKASLSTATEPMGLAANIEIRNQYHRLRHI